ncbi:unnamed protein product [Arabidopsis thaliana]|uniref:cytidine deaminase n=2 Tax=Arabidopsis TaxID=3701 RepID=A0A654FU06_ARATH|nr:Cytidine deaminase-like [Arabidopsis suecica]CAD5329457.1 unnamed protein product [Arabidopsis thaliana]VYS64342.1 unnamed protein product [Arabidopsis thaliana]
MAQQYKFVFTAEQAASEGVTDHKKLPKLIRKARNLVKAPSKVGAVGRASSGRFYLGVNVEFKGLLPHFSIHAEQFLIANLALNSEPKLTHLAVSDNGTVFQDPCYDCTHFLKEINNAHQIEILIKNAHGRDGSFKSLESHMPDEFGSESILSAEPSLLLMERDNCLALIDEDSAAGGISSNADLCSFLKLEALKAANKSYAPYRKCPSGVALFCEGEVYAGWYIETVDRTISLGPVQAALVDFIARGEGKGFDKITGAVLVEKKDAKVGQEDTARKLLEKIAAPNCDFKVFHCQEERKDWITGAVLVEKKDAKEGQEGKLLEKIAAPNCDFKVSHCDEELKDWITGAVLVEKKDAMVGQEGKLLEEIAAPNCDFKVSHCDEELKDWIKL